MHAVRLLTRIDASHRLSPDLPADRPQGEAEVIVPVRPKPVASTVPAAPQGTSLLAFFQDLDRRPQRPSRSREDIDAQIAAERAGWD